MPGRRIGLCCGATRAPRQVKGRSVAVSCMCCRPLHFDLSTMRKTVGQEARSSRQDVATLRFKLTVEFHFPLNQYN